MINRCLWKPTGSQWVTAIFCLMAVLLVLDGHSTATAAVGRIEMNPWMRALALHVGALGRAVWLAKMVDLAGLLVVYWGWRRWGQGRNREMAVVVGVPALVYAVVVAINYLG